MKSYYIIKTTKATRQGFAYQATQDQQYWNGTDWTINRERAMSFVSNPKARLACSKLSDVEIVVE